jgi:D-glycero-alpha-D-manno-heptose-7-phosphate kinase
VSRAIVARAPTRLDFGGGWTDVAPYSEDRGSAVCNIAITRHATATVASSRPVSATPQTQSTDALVRAALRRADLPNARAAIASDFPIGAGLGGSSAAGVALAGALAALRGAVLSAEDLADLSCTTEREDLSVAGGFQDHYAAAIGGALLLTYDGRVSVDRLELDPGFAEAMARRIVLLYTGESRISGRTITAVADACRAGEPRVCDALDRMKSLAVAMADALRAADLDTLGSLVGEHWIHQRALHPSITTPRIDAIDEAAHRAGALGVKALGASGGGCVMAIATEGGEAELAHALAPLGERLLFSVDRAGFEVIAVLDDEHGVAAESHS